MRVKIFSVNAATGKKNQQIFEDQINQWLSQNKGVEIVKIKQSASGGSFGASLWMISVCTTKVKASEPSNKSNPEIDALVSDAKAAGFVAYPR